MGPFRAEGNGLASRRTDSCESHRREIVRGRVCRSRVVAAPDGGLIGTRGRILDLHARRFTHHLYSGRRRRDDPIGVEANARPRQVDEAPTESGGSTSSSRRELRSSTATLV